MRGFTLKFAAALATCFLSCGMVIGQAVSGDMVGSIKDTTGALVTNANITVTNEATGVTVTATSDKAGEFRMQNLLPGAYDVKVTAQGFTAYTLRGVTITAGATATENATLSVTSAQSVEVEAFAGVSLDTTSNNLTTSLGSEELAILPTATVGFGVLNASLLAPNVASPGGAGIGTGPSVGGQRPRNNNYTIEGIDDNDKSVTGPLVTIPNDAVGDFTLITSQFSPEFGHSSGGQFNTSVLSGTNRYHGKLYEYFDNRNLNAEDAIAGGKTPNSRFDFNRYGGQFGGPIKHDKLFFFGNFERSTTGRSLNAFLCTPTATGIAALNTVAATYGFRATNLQQYLALTPTADTVANSTLPDKQQVTDANDQACGDEASGPQYLTVFNAADYFGGANPLETNINLGNAHITPPSYTNTDQITTSADYTLSSKDNFRFRYSYVTSGSIDTSNALQAFFVPLPVKEHLMAFSYFHNFSANLINEARIGYNRLAQNFPVAGPSFPGLGSFPNLIFFDADIDIGPDDTSPQSGIQNLYQLTDNVTYTRGRHTFKLGFDGRKYISPQNFVQRQRGDYEYGELGLYLLDYSPDAFGERSAGAQNYAGDQTAFYGYGNDTWRVTDRLTLNYGLRYEFTSVPSGERRQALNAISNVPGVITFGAPQPQYTNFAPRVGIAYAPDDKTSIRAGFGIAYDVLFDNLGLLTSPPQLSQTNDVDLTQNPTPGFLAGGGLPSALTPITSPTVARYKTAAYLPNQILPYSENYNLTIQRVFLKNYTAELQYLGTRGIHLATQNQLNIVPKVTAANQLTTYITGPTANSATAPTYATTPTSTTVNTLSKIQALSFYDPTFAAAGFNNPAARTAITSYQPFGGSNYNGLGFNVTRRFINGFQMNASYTFSKALDDSTAEVNASDLTQRRPQDSRNQHAEYARSALDRTQRLTVEAVYDVPYFKHSGFLLRNLAGNWQLSPIYTYETPEYVTPSSEANANQNGDSGTVSRTIINGAGDKQLGSGNVPVYSSNPALVALCGVGTGRCNANLVGYLATNPNAYYIKAGAGTLPTASRNTLAGRPIDNLSMAAGKRISFTERYSFEFQAQAFNLFNHAQYVPGDIDGISSTSTAGAATNYLNPANGHFNQPQLQYTAHARSLQLAAKLNF